MENNEIHSEVMTKFEEAKISFAPRADAEDSQAYLTRLAYAIAEWPNEVWDTLSEQAQAWFNTMATALSENKPLPENILEVVDAPKVVNAPEKRPRGRRVGVRPPGQAPSATEFAFTVVLTNPAVKVAGVASAMEEAGMKPLGAATLNGLIYSARTCLRILETQGRLKSSV